MTLVVRAFAKINLGLEILAKREDGYHELRTILQTIDFGDELTFRPTQAGIQLTTNRTDIPEGSNNLVYRAAALVAERAPRGSGVSIQLKKSVPPCMGLGGGSADAAATLRALDRLWRLELSETELHRLACSIGMDVPFFLHGGTALAVGRGDEVFPTGLELDWPIVLILPDFGVSTAETYANLRLTKRQSELTLLQDFTWRSPSIRDGLGELVNHLEVATGEHFASIQEFKQKLLECDARGSMMAGSGSAVFGVFQDVDSAHTVADALCQSGLHAFATRMLPRESYRRRWLSSEGNQCSEEVKSGTPR